MKRLIVTLWVGGAALYVASAFVFLRVVDRPVEFERSSTAQPSNSEATVTGAVPPANGILQENRPASEPKNILPTATVAEPQSKGEARTATPEQAPAALPGQPKQGATAQQPDQAPSDQLVQDRVAPIPPDEAMAQPRWAEISRAAKLRQWPSRSASRTGAFPRGTKLQVLGQEDEWVHVMDPASSEQGWIKQRHLRPVSPPAMEASVSEPEDAEEGRSSKRWNDSEPKAADLLESDLPEPQQQHSVRDPRHHGYGSRHRRGRGLIFGLLRRF
jgi:hypothetical protein